MKWEQEIVEKSIIIIMKYISVLVDIIIIQNIINIYYINVNNIY